MTVLEYLWFVQWGILCVMAGCAVFIVYDIGTRLRGRRVSLLRALIAAIVFLVCVFGLYSTKDNMRIFSERPMGAAHLL